AKEAAEAEEKAREEAEAAVAAGLPPPGEGKPKGGAAKAQGGEAVVGDVDEIEGIRDKKLAAMGVAGDDNDQNDEEDEPEATDGGMNRTLNRLQEFARIRGTATKEDIDEAQKLTGVQAPRAPSRPAPAQVAQHDDDDDNGGGHTKVSLPDGGIAG